MNVVLWLLVVRCVFAEKVDDLQGNTTRTYSEIVKSGTTRNKIDREAPTASNGEESSASTTMERARRTYAETLKIDDSTTWNQPSTVGSKVLDDQTDTSTSTTETTSNGEESSTTEDAKPKAYSTDSESSSAPSSETPVSSTPEPTPPCPTEIPNVTLTVSPSGYNITLDWETPENLECIIEYIIYLNDEQVGTAPASSTTFIIEDLDGCTEYKIGIAISYGNATGNTTEIIVKTTLPDDFKTYQVSNLIADDASGKTFLVSWDEPAKQISQCIDSYDLIWWDEDDVTTTGTTKTVLGNETSCVFDSIGCMTFRVQVKAKNGDENEGNVDSVSFTAPKLVTNPPSLVTWTRSKTYFNVTWQVDDVKINKCPLQEMFVTCTADPEKNNDYSWLIKDGGAAQAITTSVDSRYAMSVENLSPFTNYSCFGVVKNSAGNSSQHDFDIQTDEEVPPKPASLDVKDVGPYDFTLEWTAPEEVPGILTGYTLEIKNGGPQSGQLTECSNNVTNKSVELGPEMMQYIFDESVPYYIYVIELWAKDNAGDGEAVTIKVRTNATEPDSVKNINLEPPVYSDSENYRVDVNLTFDPPCNTNGPFNHYEIAYEGVRANFETDQGIVNSTNDKIQISSFLPERSYSFNVTVVTEAFRSEPSSSSELVTRSGVPKLGENISNPTSEEGSTKAFFKLNRTAFTTDMGEVLYYALFLTTTTTTGGGFGFWEGTNDSWPNPPLNTQQLTPNLWNPFNESDSFSCTFGDNPYCSKSALEERKDYKLIVRAFTKNAYKDSAILNFKTDMVPGLELGLILGLVFGILTALLLVIFLIFLWRRKRKSAAIFEEEKRPSNPNPSAIPVHKFANYYANIKEDYDVIKQQFADLGIQSKGSAGETTFAVLPENRRKNRWTNILPYDSTRVTLKIDEDDEISSDYINASYIKGYSGKVEYIATQGPLEQTARDFWKMILQENVTIIAMVAQFVEQSKVKCHHYFPSNHETMNFGESLEVKCSTELHFGTYCIRTLQVRKGTEQREIVHMQFLEWPDFGVPQGTDNMLQFSGQLREKANKEGGLIVVHCSAGVGRTGTLIALDILLQTIDDHRDINIYKTVLDLRKQRTNMVQTEKQYMYIHTCVKDYIDAPNIPTNDAEQERIYENVEVIRSSLKTNLIETDVESAL